MVGVVFAGIHGEWLQDNCKWEDNYGTVRSVFYDSGWGNHYYVLDVDGQRIESYEPYAVGDKYLISSQIVSCPPQ